MMAAPPLLTIVTYHYIRQIAGSAWPRIKGLEIERFRGQLDYIQRYYTPIGVEHLFAHARGEKPDWPARPLLLTFDDGYLDHYRHAFKELTARGLTGAFFAPAQSLLDRHMLDVNKVHFVLAAEPDHEKLADQIDRSIAAMSKGDVAAQIATFHEMMRKPSRWDPAETVYVKRVLQRGPDATIRSAIASNLFKTYVSEDEADFAEGLYLSPVQAREMIDAGMHFGSHGDRHIWFNHSTAQEQRRDIEGSLRLRTALGLKLGEYSFCYPYGGYTETTLGLMHEHEITLGFTTRLELNDMTAETAMLELARIDAGVDVPCAADAPLSCWTERALS
jgi:peptidoglycan/xylan/chitin deacetylase (PgdA/CDA1 family)